MTSSTPVTTASDGEGFSSWIRRPPALKTFLHSILSNTWLFQFPHLLQASLLVNMLYFCAFINETSNLSNFNLLTAHLNLSCFCLPFFPARMLSILLLNICFPFKTRRECHLLWWISTGERMIIGSISCLLFTLAAKACGMHTARTVCSVFLLPFKLSEVRYLWYTLCGSHLSLSEIVRNLHTSLPLFWFWPMRSSRGGILMMVMMSEIFVYQLSYLFILKNMIFDVFNRFF